MPCDRALASIKRLSLFLAVVYALYPSTSMATVWYAMIGIFMGFVFGVGCALAVMYSIFTGGYGAALRDSRLSDPPERYLKAIARLDR